ncbi:MAG TPA: pyridoxal phosphate-dependent aminotransferase [Steroidobacteraceae bacterium]|nr:pyridoxal phosphate-dependent aminotransferase [Steroidobacteraceae bacterium]
MKVPPFKLDAWLAAHDFATPPIRYNIASSTGPLWTFGELMALGSNAGNDAASDKGNGSLATLGDITLSYAPPQGSKLLRERVAALHAVDPDHVLMMTGASEAIVALTSLVAGAGGSIVIPRPVYPAVPVLARAWGLGVREYALDREQGFAQTADGVLAAVDSSTRLVFVNTPHNPTGAVMPPAEQRKLAEALAERGIPLVVDEVYHPLYFGERLPSASALPNTIVLGDFAKALSIPGLRIGWLVDRDAHRREALMDLRSYFTISGSPLTEAIGAHALAHAPDIIARLTQVAQGNLALLARFMEKHRDVFGWAPPGGGTTCFPWLRDGRDARPLCEALAKAGVLAAPGDCFEMPSHIRVGFGAMRNGYAEALAIFGETLAKLPRV